VLRTMKEKDLDGVMAIAKEHFDAVDMASRGYTYREGDTRKYIEEIAASTEYLPIISDVEGQIDGLIFFQINYSPYNHKEMCASEHVWYVKKGKPAVYRGKLFMTLLKESVRVLKEMGISLITVSLPETIDFGESVGKFLKRNEFSRVDSIYKRRISHVSI